MKRFVILLLALLLICSLTGCGSKEYRLLQDTDEIAKIEAVKVPHGKNDEERLSIEREIRNNNFDSVEYLSEIPAEMIDDFLTELKSIPCFRTIPPRWGFWGESFLITYNDGSWQLLNRNSTSYYNKAEDKFYNPNLTFNRESFDALWNKYAQLNQ